MQKAAPTGQAALLIGGDTLHSLFRINVHGYSTKKEIERLQILLTNYLEHETTFTHTTKKHFTYLLERGLVFKLNT